MTLQKRYLQNYKKIKDKWTTKDYFTLMGIFIVIVYMVIAG